MIKKKCYEKPALSVERFSPNAYCAGCNSYSAYLSCDYGSGRLGTAVQWSDDRKQNATAWADGTGAWHGSPCSKFSVTAKEGSITGYENGKDPSTGQTVEIDKVSGVDWSNVYNGAKQTGITWFSQNSTGDYWHYGYIEFTSDVTLDDPNHPNHS